MRHWSVGNMALGTLCVALAAGGVAQAGPAGAPASQKSARAPVPEQAKGQKDESRSTKADNTQKVEAKAGGRADKAAVKADKAEARAEAKVEKTEARTEAKAETQAKAKADKALEAAEHDDEKDAERPGHRGRTGAGHGRHSSAMHALHEDVKHGKLEKEEVKAHLAKLRANVKERRQGHREALGKRWGGALANAPVREELRHHARRSAFLNRALLVAQTEPSVKNQDKLVERIEKLIDKEEARHEKAMQRLTAAAAAPGAEPVNTPKTPPSNNLNAPAKGSEP